MDEFLEKLQTAFESPLLLELKIHFEKYTLEEYNQEEYNLEKYIYNSNRLSVRVQPDTPTECRSEIISNQQTNRRRRTVLGKLGPGQLGPTVRA